MSAESVAESSAPAVTVVVMAYNEAPSLESTVGEIVAVLERMGGDHEVLVVDDGSTDGTGAIADRLAATHRVVRVVHHTPNAGLGGVYRTGFADARGDCVTFFPADGQFPASIIPEFHGAIGSADLVLGYIPGRRGSLVGRVMSAVERSLYTGLFGGFPRFQGIFMCRRALLRQLPLQSSGRGWAVVMEFILRAQRGGYRLVNRATVIRPRRAGRSKVQNLRTIISNTRQMIALRRLL